jgi:alkylhydroperoxidase family enzyme
VLAYASKLTTGAKAIAADEVATLRAALGQDALADLVIVTAFANLINRITEAADLVMTPEP